MPAAFLDVPVTKGFFLVFFFRVCALLFTVAAVELVFPEFDGSPYIGLAANTAVLVNVFAADFSFLSVLPVYLVGDVVAYMTGFVFVEMFPPFAYLGVNQFFAQVFQLVSVEAQQASVVVYLFIVFLDGMYHGNDGYDDVDA